MRYDIVMRSPQRVPTLVGRFAPRPGDHSRRESEMAWGAGDIGIRGAVSGGDGCTARLWSTGEDER